MISDLICSKSRFHPFEERGKSYGFQFLVQPELEYVRKVHLYRDIDQVQVHFAQRQNDFHRRLKRYRKLIKGLVYLDVVRQNAIASVVVWVIVAE